MWHSGMTPFEREHIVQDRENYPLHVSFLGKKALLSFEEVAFLQSHAVDFAVDDAQVRDIMAELVEQGVLPQKEDRTKSKSVTNAESVLRRNRVPSSLIGPILSVIAAAVAFIVFLVRGVPAIRRRKR